jgi:PhnB protein
MRKPSRINGPTCAQAPPSLKGFNMPQLNAYLSFDGNCAEAMRFYARVLDARLEALITYGQTPADMPTPASHADRIMHAYLVHPDFALMAGDTPPGIPYQGVSGVMMTLTYPTAAEAQRVFAALAEGGNVTMPLGETFWADAFGMVTDRYGTPWGVNGGARMQPPK